MSTRTSRNSAAEGNIDVIQASCWKHRLPWYFPWQRCDFIDAWSFLFRQVIVRKGRTAALYVFRVYKKPFFPETVDWVLVIHIASVPDGAVPACGPRIESNNWTFGNQPITEKISATQCLALSKVLPGAVFVPSDATYTAFPKSYWSKQEESLNPSCIVRPTNAQHVSNIVKALARCKKFGVGECSFAIRGGGHTPWAGSANIHSGVIIDMR